MLLLPALLLLFPISQGYAEPTNKLTQMDRLADWVIRHHKAILPLTALITLIAGWLMLQNKVNDEAVKYFSPATEYRQSVDILEKKLSVYVIDAGGKPQLRQVRLGTAVSVVDPCDASCGFERSFIARKMQRDANHNSFLHVFWNRQVGP